MSNVFWLSKKIPSAPGVYFFKDQKDRMLYIGKAANLKSRLGSYRKTPDSRIGKMLETAAVLDWKETGSEIEALILESQLIKKYRPPYNIMLRDSKQYFFVKITKEEFPRIFLTHQLNTAPGSVKGPFTEGLTLKTTLKLLRRIIHFSTCKQKNNRHCLNYHLGNCLVFCCVKDLTAFRGRE